MRSILLFKKLLGLVEMTSGLVNVSFSLPEWQAVKRIFFAPCNEKKDTSLPQVSANPTGAINYIVTDVRLKDKYVLIQFYP